MGWLNIDRVFIFINMEIAELREFVGEKSFCIIFCVLVFKVVKLNRKDSIKWEYIIFIDIFICMRFIVKKWNFKEVILFGSLYIILIKKNKLWRVS